MATLAVSDHALDGCLMVRWLPGLRAVSSYQGIWLARDTIAGVVLTTLLVPQGMAYAETGRLAPDHRLVYLLCLLRYAVFGPSRILVLGPDSSLGPKIAATVLPLFAAKGDEQRAVALASMLAIMVAGGHDPCGHRQDRIHRRSDLQADRDRLPERPGPHVVETPTPSGWPAWRSTGSTPRCFR
jgi:hypothetical protein